MKKKEGIEIKSKLDIAQVNKIAHIISEKMCNSFPEHNFNKNDIFCILSNIDMYIAKLPENSTLAKFSYKTNTIYISDKIKINNLDTLVIHECIHALQEVKNSRGKVIKLGLYDFFHNKGEGINEAAVQLMASVCTGNNIETVKYYDLDFQTESPLYYPIETALINQIIYFIGSYPLFHSTIFGDNIFKNTFITKCNKKVYEKIENNFDLLLRYEELLETYSTKLNLPNFKYSKSEKLKKQINYIKNRIAEITLETQKEIFENCFNHEFNLIKNEETLDIFQKRLSEFGSILITNETYDFYNNYYCEMINKLEEKREFIKLYGEITTFNNLQTDLLRIGQGTYDMNFFQKLFSKLKLLFENASIKQKKEL